MEVFITVLIILSIGGLVGNILSQKFSGKYEGDQSRIKSIVIPYGKDKIIWVHHWIFYSANLVILCASYIQGEWLFKLAVLSLGVAVMIALLYFSNLSTSPMHLLIFSLMLFISVICLFNMYLFAFVFGGYIGIILHGLSYKDRFEIVRKKS